MTNRNLLKFCVSMFVFGVCSLLPMTAIDVVYLQNGEIVIGNLIGPVTGGVSYSSFGAEKTISLDTITSTEKNLDALAAKTVQVVLKDGSIIQGKIADFDEEIGVFLDISFGTLTIPIVAITEMYQSDIRIKYTGAAFQTSMYGGAYFPLLDSADYFGMSWYAGPGFDWAIPGVRGLYAGLRVTVYGMDYTEDSDITYFMVSLRPNVTYKYLGWRMKNNILAKIVPYASVGAGPAYIAIEDPDSYPANYGSITADVAINTGIEFSLSQTIVFKIEGNSSIVLQKGTPFINAGAMLALCYER